MIKIAVTGGIACGKSLFGELLAKNDKVEIFDADNIVREMHEPNMQGAKLIAATFGNEYLRPNGATNKTALAELVFNDADAREKLNSLFHPIVRQELVTKQNLNPSKPIKVALIPLLFESEWEGDWDLTVCVTASDDEQLKRLLTRGHTLEHAKQRIASQMPNAEKEARADIIIRNDGSIEQLKEAAGALLRYVMEKK
ncbi:MAG: dephospho-CoA kinase [Kiritimatiellae bacterium]|nr:dephospho-CoA kinase [Kiritimatiellia bacterium]